MTSLLRLNFRWSSWSSLRDLLHLARWMFLYKRHENHQRNRLNHNCEQKALIIIIRKIIKKITFLIKGMAFGGPYPGFTAPSQPGESDKKALVETHLKVTQKNIWNALGGHHCYIDWNPKLAISKSAMTKGNSKCNIAIINTELSNHDGRQRRHDVQHRCAGVQGASWGCPRVPPNPDQLAQVSQNLIEIFFNIKVKKVDS